MRRRLAMMLGDCPVTIKGIAPITTARRRLLSLKAFGGTEQNGTPTPDAPVDIVSNNGVVKARHQSGLPIGYTLLEYIESTGTQYIDTGIFGTDKTSAHVKYIVTEISDVSGFGIIGYQQGFRVSTTFQRVLWSNIRNNQFRYGDTLTDTFQKSNINEVIEETFGNGSWIYNGVNIPIEPTNSFTTSPNTMVLFCLKNQSDIQSFAKIKLYFCSIKENDTLVANYIPTRRNSDNVIGMYDTVSGQFFTNQGTGDFVAGNEVSDPVVGYADGTVETINVHGKNLFSGLISQFNDQGGTGTTYDYFKLPKVARYTLTLRCKRDYTGSSSVFIGFSANGGNANNGGIKWAIDQYTSSRAGDVITISNYVTGVIFPFVSIFKRGQNTLDTLTEHYDIQIEEGSTATPYEPYYNGGTATAEMLLKAGDYQDVQSVLDGVVTRNIGVKVFDGTENYSSYNWAATSATGFVGSLSDIKTAGYQVGYCTHYKIISQQSVSSSCIRLSGYSNNIYFLYPTNDNPFASVAEFKQWLADQYAAGTPVIVVYPLATPTTESVTGQTLALTNGTNVIDITQASLDNLELEVKVK